MYYIPVCWAKGILYPQSTTTSRRQAQLTIHLPYNNPTGVFDRSKDWSATELSLVFRDNLQRLPIYENGKRVVGNEPENVKCTVGPNPIPTSPPVPKPSGAPTPPTPSVTPVPSGGACSAVWQQCGGKTWTGPTCCQAGSVCTVTNEWYSQCTPAPSSSPTTKPIPPPTPILVPTSPPIACQCLVCQQCEIS